MKFGSLLVLILFWLNSSFAGGIKYNIYAILSQEGEGIVKETSKIMAGYGLESFQNQGKAVHVTLYLATFGEYTLEGIKYRVLEITRNWNPFGAEFSGFSKTKGNWLFIDVKENELLQKLTDMVVMNTNEFRDKSALPPVWLSEYPEKLSAFKRYGSPNVFQNFEPHVTLLANGNSRLIDTFLFSDDVKNLDISSKFKIQAIGIAKVDQNGQIEGAPLAIYSLKYIPQPGPIH